jgi:hypothetical protein
VLKREFRKLYQQHHNATFALIAILSKAEGQTIEISEETLKEILPKLASLSWQSKRDEKGTVVLSIVDNTPKGATEPTPNVTMRYVDDEADVNDAEPTDAEVIEDVVEEGQ